MYTSIYIYRVAREKAEAFLEIQHATAAIYREYGALADETFVPTDLTAKYGCLAFSDLPGAAESEEVYVSLSRFRDRTHHDEVMAKVDADQRIDKLFEKIASLVDIHRIVRGEFEQAT